MLVQFLLYSQREKEREGKKEKYNYTFSATSSQLIIAAESQAV